MATLWFVGAGLAGERSLSTEAWDVLRRSTVVFVEEYTSALPAGTVARLREELGSDRVRSLDRASVESGAVVLEALRGSGTTALVVGGDPFAATTHVALRLQTEAAGHDWRYVPGASVLTAAPAFLGLMPYRFGRPVSLPAPAPGFAPTSPIERIAENRRTGLHSLVLLDLASATRGALLADEAIRLLLERDPARTAISPSGEVGVVARVGSDSAAAWWAPADALANADFGPAMHSVVVPAPELHFEESSAVDRFRRTPLVRR